MTSGNETEITLSAGLVPFMNYAVVVEAMTSVGFGGASELVTVATDQDGEKHLYQYLAVGTGRLLAINL